MCLHKMKKHSGFKLKSVFWNSGLESQESDEILRTENPEILVRTWMSPGSGWIWCVSFFAILFWNGQFVALVTTPAVALFLISQ